MPLTVRLDTETQHALDEVTGRLGESRSAVIRQAIRLLRDRVMAEEQGRTPYELGEELFGKYHSGHGRLSEEKTAREHIVTTLHDREVGR
jgi:predicted transcriptional regulator